LSLDPKKLAEISIPVGTGKVIQLIKTLTDQKIEYVAVKQGFRINSQNNKDMTSKVIVTIFSLLAELEI
jgi:hypothetical protein